MINTDHGLQGEDNLCLHIRVLVFLLIYACVTLHLSSSRLVCMLFISILIYSNFI